MLIRIVRMTFDPAGVARFRSIFEEVSPLIQATEGCRGVELLQDARFPNVFATYSRWDDEASLEAYRRSELFRETWARTKLLFAAAPVANSYVVPDKTDT